MTALRVWWIPQVPMKAFYVPVASVAEGVKILDILANYDIFQYENRVKPDYCNTGGLQMLEDGEWVDWCSEDGDEDPKEWYTAQLEREAQKTQTTAQRCPHDGGSCHHFCLVTCFRIKNCGPLTKPYPGFPVACTHPIKGEIP